MTHGTQRTLKQATFCQNTIWGCEIWRKDWDLWIFTSDNYIELANFIKILIWGYENGSKDCEFMEFWDFLHGRTT